MNDRGEDKISVSIIDDHQVLVEAIAYILKSDPTLNFSGAAYTLAAGKEMVRNSCPDVLLLDVMLPDGDGLSLVPEIKQVNPHTQVVVLTSFSDENTLLRAVESGVSGFISKSSSLPELLNTIRQASQGEIVMPASLLLGLLIRLPRDKAAAYREERGWERLTPREFEILIGLANGKTGNMLAVELNIAPLTVRTHIRNLMAKLGVHSRLEAVAFALRNGLIETPTM